MLDPLGAGEAEVKASSIGAGKEEAPISVLASPPSSRPNKDTYPVLEPTDRV